MPPPLITATSAFNASRMTSATKSPTPVSCDRKMFRRASSAISVRPIVTASSRSSCVEYDATSFSTTGSGAIRALTSWNVHERSTTRPSRVSQRSTCTR
ncbi:MAG TPA: hypothetical protein VGQ77_13295 [Methylomirabilota bacterium]|nr:hypothetical protein [Methylomirabilota bacterium]